MNRRLLLLAVTVGALALAPTATAADPDPIEGTLFSRVVATFDPPLPASVSIDWDDGTTTTGGPVKLPSGKGEVTASHTYAKQGTYSVKVTDKADASNSQRTSITVTDAPIAVTGTTFPVGSAAGGVIVARIVDSNPLGVPGSLKATIDWGDGTTGDGTITAVAGQPATFEVRGAHAYPDGATYLAGVRVSSSDGGTAKGDAQSTADGAPEPDVPDKGRILDLGRGFGPSLAVDPAGTAHVVFATPAPGRTGDAVVYCALPRGAKGCSLRRRFLVDALAPPVILRSRTGTLYIVVSYNGVAQIGGGTLLMTSGDGGATWGYTFYPVNTGVFQGRIIDATLSQNQRFLYALFGDFVPGDKAQVLATIPLDRAGLTSDINPGRTQPLTGTATIDIPRIPYSVRSVGVLPDGRVAIIGYDSSAPRKTVPRAAVRLIADADGNPLTAPWAPARGGLLFRLAGSPRAAAVLGAPDCGKPLEISNLRGSRLGAPRPLGLATWNSCGDNDLFADSAGGRHVVWLSDSDGCQGTGPHEGDRDCIIYRRASPGGDFGPKTTIANPKFATSFRVAAAPDGVGWIAWRDFSGADRADRVLISPTFTASEAVVGAHRIALKFTPSAECAKRDPVTAAVTVSGPAAGRPRVQRVTWSTTKGMLPRRRVDAGSPFTVRLTVDRREFSGLGSTGSIIFTMTVRAKVRYSIGRSARSATLTQPLSFYCGVRFDSVTRGR